MDRRLLAVLPVVLFALLWPASPAAAGTPTVPLEVSGRTAGSPLAVELRWSAPPAAVDGYRVQIVNETSHWWGAVRSLPAGATATTYRDLEPGATYRFSVAAVVGGTVGPRVLVRYHVPGGYRPTRAAYAPTEDLVYSIAADGSLTPAMSPGTGNTVSALTVDRAGNLYGHVDETDSIIRVSARGGVTTTVATDVPEESRLGTADDGELFLQAGAGIQRPVVIERIDLFGVRTVIGRSPSWTYGASMTVDGAGNVRLVYTSPGRVLHVLTIPRDGSPAVDQSIAHALPEHDGAVLVRALSDRQGNLYVHEQNPQTEVPFVSRIARGAERAVLLSTRPAYYGYAVDQAGQFHLAQSRTWCSQRSEWAGTCVPDRTVPEILRYPASGGAPTAVPVRGLSTSISEHGVEIAVDGAGMIWAAKIRDEAELLRYPRSGGEPASLAARYLVQLVSN